MSTMTLEQTFTSLDAAVLTGASHRQLHRYATMRVAGDRPGQGHGRHRTYTATDLEVIVALQGLLALGGPIALLAPVVGDAVRARPVSPAGEWLIVTTEPARAQRWDRFLLDEIVATGTPVLWPVRLRSFSTSALPVSDGGDVVPAEHAPPPAGMGSGGVEPDPSHTGFPRLGGSNNEGGAL